MDLLITEKQLELILSTKGEMKEQDAEGNDPEAAKPTTGTSPQQSGGKGYPEVGKWESGVDRSGPSNQVKATKWSDIVGSKLTRGKANQLK